MDPLTPRLAELLPVYGPALLFVMAVLETSFLTGLVVPAGPALALAAVLALDGGAHLWPLVAAALAGGLVGDSLGFWVGRTAGTQALSGEGRWGRLTKSRYRNVGATLGRHPFISVSLARLVSFVRTFMPLGAGMSNLSYRTFLLYDAPAVVAWAGLYLGVGILARESWLVATRILGAWGGLAFVGVGVFLWWSLQRQGRRSTARSPEDPS